MKIWPVLLLVLSIVAAPAIAQKVYIDYDHDFDFDPVETFAYVDTPDSNADPLSDGRIRTLIIEHLTEEGGLRKVESDADLYITYHVTTEDSTVLNTSSFGYGGYGGGWGGYGRYGHSGYGGGGMSTTTASTYTEGTLVVDAYEPSEKKMVWRGSGTVTVKDNPSKQEKQIQNVLQKMGKKWQKILASQGK